MLQAFGSCGQVWRTMVRGNGLKSIPSCLVAIQPESGWCDSNRVSTIQVRADPFPFEIIILVLEEFWLRPGPLR